MLYKLLILFFPFLMIYSASSDLFSMKISNKVSVLLIFGFCFFAYLIQIDMQAFLWHWVLFLAVLVIGIALFSIGAVGGGDAKLAAATALWLGWEHTLAYFFLASMIGALLTLMILRLRSNLLPASLIRVEWVTRLYRADSGIPYGIALGVAAVLVYPDTIWMEEALKLAAAL